MQYSSQKATNIRTGCERGLIHTGAAIAVLLAQKSAELQRNGIEQFGLTGKTVNVDQRDMLYKAGSFVNILLPCYKQTLFCLVVF
jgi:hypothetical protein